MTYWLGVGLKIRDVLTWPNSTPVAKILCDSVVTEFEISRNVFTPFMLRTWVYFTLVQTFIHKITVTVWYLLF